MSPLVLATSQGGYTNFVQFLLKAGADPNIPDDVCFVYFFRCSADSGIQYSILFSEVLMIGQ